MRQSIVRGVIRGLLVAIGLLAAQSLALAQAPSWNGGPPGAQPNQPAGPQLPTLQRRPARQEAPPWFPLSPQEQMELDRVLEAWQQRSNEVKSFECSFTCWEYDAIFVDRTKPDKASFTDHGTIRYAAPDKGLFEVEGDKTEDPQGQRWDKWICDGKSVFRFERPKKELHEYPLPPELQGKGITNSPLPFLFGAEAENLRKRYYLHIVTPRDAQGEIWLEGWPRFQQDKANFHHAQLILLAKGMVPSAMQIYETNSKDRKVYKFDDVLINNPWRMFGGNPFHAYTPLGWTKIVQRPQLPAQANRAPLSAGR
jgi:TIGR03009 family protein